MFWKSIVYQQLMALNRWAIQTSKRQPKVLSVENVFVPLYWGIYWSFIYKPNLHFDDVQCALTNHLLFSVNRLTKSWNYLKPAVQCISNFIGKHLHNHFLSYKRKDHKLKWHWGYSLELILSSSTIHTRYQMSKNSTRHQNHLMLFKY